MATINDVAKRAGVSRGTVSNVINGAKVRPESKAKVEKAIKELGYIPNAYARSLKLKKTNTIALIIPSVWYPFFSKLINDIEERLKERGYKLLLCISHNDYKRELEYLNMAKENKVDGIIFITYSDISSYLKDSQIPAVAIERYFSQSIPFISTDNFEGGAIAAQKLNELGCRKPAFVGRKAEKNNVTEFRRQGFECWCRENGIEFDEFYVEASSENFVEKIIQWVHEKFENALPYDGLFVAVDRYADHIIEALSDMDTPASLTNNLQIIGFDGIEAYPNENIRISSIRQPVEELAAQAVNTLCALIDGENYDPFILLPPTFIQGKTTRVNPIG